MNPTQRYAIDYWTAGLSLVPLTLDGLRKPVVPWKRYQTERPTLEQVQDWFARPAGIGLVMGAVSGGAECIDFDDAATFEPIYSSFRPSYKRSWPFMRPRRDSTWSTDAKRFAAVVSSQNGKMARFGLRLGGKNV